jgi:hypothetical protein
MGTAESQSRGLSVKIWKSAGVLHGYPKVTGPQDEALEIPGDVRQYAADGHYVICICLEHKLTGRPDPRLVFVKAPATA